MSSPLSISSIAVMTSGVPESLAGSADRASEIGPGVVPTSLAFLGRGSPNRGGPHIALTPVFRYSYNLTETTGVAKPCMALFKLFNFK